MAGTFRRIWTSEKTYGGQGYSATSDGETVHFRSGPYRGRGHKIIATISVNVWEDMLDQNGQPYFIGIEQLAAGKAGRLSNGVMQRSLSNHLEHPIKVSGVKDRRIISWSFGPHRENVWAAVVGFFPELAVEEVSSAIKSRGVKINDGYFYFPIPVWVRRLDFLTAPVEAFPELIFQGGDPNETDPYGISPLEHAISRRQSRRAAALIEAGAFFESYGPDGWQRQLVEDMPEVIAAMEKRHLRQITAIAFGEGRSQCRL